MRSRDKKAKKVDCWRDKRLKNKRVKASDQWVTIFQYRLGLKRKELSLGANSSQCSRGSFVHG
jgi:hypothetical protein